MSNYDKNEKMMAHLTKKAKAHPELWVEDITDVFDFRCDEIDPEYEIKLKEFQYTMDFLIDWFRPSKNRLYALHLESLNQYIYLTREKFLEVMRPYWRDKKEEQTYYLDMVSLDALHDEYELEVDASGRLLTKDNYYKYEYEQESSDVLSDVLKEAIIELKPAYKQIVGLLMEGKSYSEIGSIVGISKPNVEGKIRRIRKILEKFK